MEKLTNRSLMIFKLAPEKLNELTNFIDLESESLIVLTPIEEASSGAIFLEKTSLEILFEKFENAS